MAVKWAGVPYLLSVGIRAIRATPRTVSDVPFVRPRELYPRGFLTSAANPKAMFFFAALFPQFIDPAALIEPQLLVLGLTYLTVDRVVLFARGTIAGRVLGALRSRSRGLSRASGSLMLAAAGLLALRAPGIR